MSEGATTLDGEVVSPSKYLSWDDLKGRDVTVEISSAQISELVGEKGVKERTLVLGFKGASKRMICNKTNRKAIGSHYGREARNWIGKSITVYPTTCTSFGQTGVHCVRVRARED
jgi:hypothetical protein